MAKKKKLNNSDPSINLRLPQELKDQLNEKAFIKSQTVSAYVRNLIAEYLSGELYQKEIEFYKNTSFVSSLEFMQLVVWIYEKQSSKGFNSNDLLMLPTYIRTLKQVEGNVPNYLSKEFDFVLADVLTMRKNDVGYKLFKFPENNSFNRGFNYKVLEDYLRNLNIED